jgi:hypothetical protein
MPAPLDLVGQRYGRLTVTGPRERRNGQTYWTCRCDCGNTKTIYGGSLRRGLTTSCGCYRAEASSVRNYRHGGNLTGRRRPEYTVWVLMRQRCEKPNVPHYAEWGGRGITVCERWADFGAFFADMGERPTPKHTLERIDNDGPYAPENCRWATRREQANNTRRNHHVTLDDRTRTTSQWARETGIPVATLHARLHRLGWAVEKALTTPVRPWSPGRKRGAEG